jgi:hypothetical protein
MVCGFNDVASEYAVGANGYRVIARALNFDLIR